MQVLNEKEPKSNTSCTLELAQRRSKVYADTSPYSSPGSLVAWSSQARRTSEGPLRRVQRFASTRERTMFHRFRAACAAPFGSRAKVSLRLGAMCRLRTSVATMVIVSE